MSHNFLTAKEIRPSSLMVSALLVKEFGISAVESGSLSHYKMNYSNEYLVGKFRKAGDGEDL